MLEQSQKLTDGLIVFSARLSDHERLDFKNDALAGVRANFFNSNRKEQSDTTEVNINGLGYSLTYSMKPNAPLAWKATRNFVPYQCVQRGGDGFYCVITYGCGGEVYKRQFFNGEHLWLKTEYYDRKAPNKLLTVVYTQNVCGITAVTVEDYGANGKTDAQILFPSDAKPSLSARMLVYSNRGMLWYDQSLAPTDLPPNAGSIGKNTSSGGFRFSKQRLESFNEGKAVNTLNLDNCEYLTDGDPAGDDGAIKTESEEAADSPYSAYDIIEKILTDVSNNNGDLLGKAESDTPAEPPKPDPEADKCESMCEDLREGDEAERYTGAHFKDSDDLVGGEPSENDAAAGTARCSLVVLTKSGRYTYYGGLDQNNCRTGRGRTVSPNGLTSYDGEYRDDMRSGFGVCYYKNGAINYVGDWSNNARSGRGVGYRQSDGTMHAGNWLDNSPEGVGARFDGEGKFIDVCSYNGGMRSGKSVSFDNDGNVVVAVYENGEKISEHVIDDEVLKKQ